MKRGYQGDCDNRPFKRARTNETEVKEIQHQMGQLYQATQKAFYDMNQRMNNIEHVCEEVNPLQQHINELEKQLSSMDDKIKELHNQLQPSTFTGPCPDYIG